MTFTNPFTFRPDTFIFHSRWKLILEPYPAEVRLEVYEAITDYVYEGQTRDLKPLSTMAFSFIQDTLNRNLERMEEKKDQCSKAGRASASRREQAEQAIQPAQPAQTVPSPPAAASDADYATLLEGFREANRIAYEGWRLSEKITDEEFIELGCKVLSQWEVAGWRRQEIPVGRERYHSLDLLKWIKTQKRIDNEESSRNEKERPRGDRRHVAADTYEERQRELAEYVARSIGEK